MTEPLDELYIGRETETERARTVIERAISGQGQTLSVAGEPGIGKTVLLEWIASIAEGLGATVFTARCYDDQGSPAYWPWNDIVRSHLRTLDESTANELYGDQVGRLATAFPALRGRIDEAVRVPEMENPAEARFLLHDEFAGVLRRVAEEQPLVILIDDLHWADEASLLLLEFLSKSLAHSPVLITFAHWDLRQAREAPLTRLLGGLSRERAFHRLQLRRLDSKDSKTLVSSLGLTEVSEQTEKAIFQLSEGNPFFIGEIARLLLSDEVDHRELRSPDTIPDSIRSTMTRRLGALSPGAISVLETAAVIGQEFDVAVLRASVSPDQSGDVMQYLEEARSYRFVERGESQSTHWRFHHGLIQRTLVAELPSHRKEMLHSAVLKGLEDVLGDAVDERASELAEHAIQAESVLGPERVVHYCLVAGERALEALLPGSANRQFEEAISRTDLDQCNDQTARLLSGYAHSLFASGDLRQIVTAAVHSRLAVECFIRLGRPYDAARHLARPIRADYGLTGAAGLFRTVIEQIDPESREAGFLYAGLILWSYLDEFDFDASLASYEKAMRIADATNDEYLRVLCLTYFSVANRHYGNRGTDVEVASRAAALALKLGRRYVEAQARFITSTDYVFNGQISMARSDADRGLHLARELNNTYRLMSAISARIELALVTCDFDLARSLASEASELDPNDDRVVRDLTCADFLTGNFDEAEKGVNSLVAIAASGLKRIPVGRSRSFSSISQPLIAATVGAVMTGNRNLLTAVRPSLTEMLEKIESDIGESQAAVGLLCTRLEPDPGLAARLLRTVETPIEWKWLRASVGSVALMAGDEERARTEFESSYKMFQDEFSPLPLAWTCLEYSGALIKLNDLRDSPLITELHELGIKIATDHGMPPIRKMLERSRDDYAAARPEVVQRPAGLSEREIEVLRYLASGLSNSEIADQLVISPHTVNRHVTNLFSKLNVSSRAAATGQAHRLGIV